MLNSIETYQNAGIEAAQAVHKTKDAARAKHVMWWFSQAKNLETPEDREKAIQAYQEAYMAESRQILGFK